MLTPAVDLALSSVKVKVNAQTRGIVMLMQMKGPNIDVDRAAAAHLQSRGHDVRLVDQSTPSREIGMPELVIVSSTVSSKDVAAGWRTLAVPMLTWENDLLDDFAMTGKRHDVDFGEAEKERYLWLVNALKLYTEEVTGADSTGRRNTFDRGKLLSVADRLPGRQIHAHILTKPFKRELVSCLRTGRALRVPRAGRT
ncbi:hypothetical protein BPMI_00534 [Candidatus Burkholderia pumila]|uniref:Uncharacterized protein n=1 Tax=Candidatus Burkholderia pumila TaxID=1090375 RepID=A0ABR5HJU0_9BURK|nr:hypothetical protein BPMI_00534 [Candidatus Burkholderia pumila]